MRPRARVLAAASLALALAGSATPAHAAPLCGGFWTSFQQRTCTFTPVAGHPLYIEVRVVPSSPGARPYGVVEVFVSVPGAIHKIGQCPALSLLGPVAVCGTFLANAYPGQPHTCRSAGVGVGSFSCGIRPNPPR